MAANGAPVKRVMTDNAFAYRLSRDFQDALAALGAKHVLIKPRHPWQNGKAERFNRTLQEGWAYRQPFTSNQAPHRGPAAMARLLQQLPAPRQPWRQTTHQQAQPTYWLSTTSARRRYSAQQIQF